MAESWKLPQVSQPEPSRRLEERYGAPPRVLKVKAYSPTRPRSAWPSCHPSAAEAEARRAEGYGATEGGRDYNTTLIPEGELRDVYLPPFRACVAAGAAA